MALPPGTPVYIGDRPAQEMELSIISYNARSAEIKHVSSIDELLAYKNDSKKAWINISGLKDVDAIKRLGEFYDIHTLTIEDILYTEQQPKAEAFEGYGFLSIKTIQQERKFIKNKAKKKKFFAFFKKKEEPQPDEFIIDQVSMIIMKNVLITFQEIRGDSFDGIRKRILDDVGGVRKKGMDYLAYMIIDAVVDEYFLALNNLENAIEDFEERATKTADDTFIEELQDTKKYLLQIRRAIAPLIDNILFTRHEQFFHTAELQPFLQDLRDHLNHAMITLEHHREWLSSIMEVNLSVLSHQMNKVMKVLATISTIFIPLTFVGGVYGMNFEFMPELTFKYGYFIVLGGMGLIAFGMIIFFKIRHWF